MLYEIPGYDVNWRCPYATDVNEASRTTGFWPLVAYAIFYHETIHGEVCGLWDAATVVSADGGHGLGQITPPNPIPPDWQNPVVNAIASMEIMKKASEQWAGFAGEALVRLIADTYNAGFAAAWRGHLRGDADMFTTRSYGQHVLAYYRTLVNGTPLEDAAFD